MIMRTKAAITEPSIMLKQKEERAPRREERTEAKPEAAAE
jgi:small subunit ribosomal protein S6